MSSTTVISIDAMGGDRGPAAVLDGMVRALRRNPGLRFLVHGDQSVISPLISRRKILNDNFEIRHCPGVVRMEDKPARAIRERRDSSMWHSLQTVAKGDAEVAVSSGNTGALMGMSVFVLRKASGVDRPAIAVQWPADNTHGYNTVLDMGADIRADARSLLQYSVMGAEYARLSYGIEHPRVGVLNIGTEETKGPDERRVALQLIAEAAQHPAAMFRSVGFVEGNDLPGNKADVIVTDGFTGNVALKAAEGTASFIRRTLKGAFKHSIISQLGALLVMPSLKRFSKRIDPRRVNGGVFLSLNGTVVKSHGGADAVGFESAIGLAAKMAESNFSERVAKQLAALEDPLSGTPDK